jgi:eukaryotic-like serine/threonine-protein kinase
MATKLGHFEILGELAKSATGTVYKANDPESGQTIALKAIRLSAFGESSPALMQALLAEAESTKVLSCPNLTNVFGAGEIDGQFCAAMDYVQGNSIATMLARNEGFSIWDLLDIGRQLCAGLDHAASHGVVHYSLEPSKIMCGWDGTVKILSFGVSSVGNFIQHAGDGIPSIMHYMPPEQIRGEKMDGRSNLYSLGAILYEMVTERKPFDCTDVESLRCSILESAPAAPNQVSPKVHPLLSQLIMKSLSKDPEERYHSGRELLDDLEKCKESKPVAKKPEAKPSPAIAQSVKAAAQSKFVGTDKAPVAPVAPPASVQPQISARPNSQVGMTKAAAAGAKASVTSAPSASMSSAVSEPATETYEPQVDTPKIAVDPMMAGGAASAAAGPSFSDISELPPLKEVYIAPPPPPSPADPAPAASTPVGIPSSRDLRRQEEDKPKVQPGELAKKAVKEVASVPPKLYLYALAGAIGVILLIGLAVMIYVHHQNGDEDSGAAHTPARSEAPVHAQATQPVAIPAVSEPAQPNPSATESPEAQDPVSVAHPGTKLKSRAKKLVPEPAVAILPGQLALDSNPQGAQVQIDGKSDASWVTPFSLTNVQPGQHSIIVSKAGYSTDSRTIEVMAGNRATASIRLAQLMATLVVKSDPPGASIYIDGKDMGTKTPGQLSLDKGQHVVLVRMPGYIDETMNGQFTLGQTSSFSPTLRPLGNADSVKTVGKMSKLFGGKGAQPGQATLTIRTQPKGAQIAVNQRMLEKTSPVDLALDPGNYIVDITLSGYAPVHKVVNAEKGGKLVVDETLQKQ